MSENSRSPRIAVLGAGPIGVEAAIYGAALGHDVVVLEQGSVGQSVTTWGHVTLFSPWRMNITPLGARLLREMGRTTALENPEHCPTGHEFVREYLLPLSGCFSPGTAKPGRLELRTSCRIVAVGRPALLKGERIGQEARAEHRFRLLLEEGNGLGEHIEYADIVLDCTGTYLCPNAIGDGGIPAPGERWLTARLVRHLPDVLRRDRKRFARRRTLLIGNGLSAATTAAGLAQLCKEEPGSQIVWAVRKKTPYAPIPNDPLPGRARLLDAASRVAQSTPENLGHGFQFRPGTVIDALAAEGHQLRVRLRSLTDDSEIDRGQGPAHEELFDEVIGLTGYGPDRSIYEQLQVHECYASFGPMKLAASLLGDGTLPGADCLAQSQSGPETLKNPEPGLYILGAKSYGKNSAFLLQLGHAQVRGVYSLIHNNEGLDLYAHA